MEQIAELKVTVRKMEVYALTKSKSGITRAALLLAEKSEEVVTDRILISEDQVRTLNFGK